MADEAIAKLKRIIETEVFVTKEDRVIMSKRGTESNWLFDFRTVLLRAEVLAFIGHIFHERYVSRYPFQIGCLEVAGIPLMTGIAYHLHTHKLPVNSFFIRKSRKKYGLLNMIEGVVTDEHIILVDDIINSGDSFMRQVEVLEGLGKKVTTVFSLLQFRDAAYYTYFHERGIKVESLFMLDDFSDTLGVMNLKPKPEVPTPMPFAVDWYFKSEQPNYFYVVPKSAPVLDETKLYFGSDSGNFWALHQADGTVAWKYKVGYHAKGKSIFSTPAVFQTTVYFGAYDGNFYALNTETGKPRWIFMEADWVGSSPVIAPKHNLVYIGLEFGLIKKQGGLAALNASTGKKVWEHTMPAHVHASPGYSAKYDVVVCGSNNNTVYAFDAKTGEVRWEFATAGEVKAGVAFDNERGLVLFGSHDANLYALDVTTGKLVWQFAAEFAIYSTPCVYGETVYVTSLDKHVYALNSADGALRWKFLTSGRVFASPAIVDGVLYVGSNDGRLYGLATTTGERVSVFQATERITNAVAYNAHTKRLFLPTFANEILALSDKSGAQAKH